MRSAVALAVVAVATAKAAHVQLVDTREAGPASTHALQTRAVQGTRTKVTYTVEFRTTGALLDPNCTATGTDVLTGTLVGYEPPPKDGDNEYVGTLTRSTRITTCGSRRNTAGVDVVCSISYVGDGFADVVFTVYEGNRGGYLQYLEARAPRHPLLPPRPLGTLNEVTGTCDPAELAQLENDYDTGQTAGSPSGQPIEVSKFPPDILPIEFKAKPPISIWTMRVISRRP